MKHEGIKGLGELIKSKGYSQKGFAEQIGKTTMTLLKWEKGETKPSKGDVVLMLYLLHRSSF